MSKFVIMKKETNTLEQRVIENVRRAMSAAGFYQARLAIEADIPDTALSKILNGDQRMTLDYLSKIARALSLREIDLITYPDRYICSDDGGAPAEVLLQMRLTKEKKDQVLKLVFGENSIEILNK